MIVEQLKCLENVMLQPTIRGLVFNGLDKEKQTDRNNVKGGK